MFGAEDVSEMNVAYCTTHKAMNLAMHTLDMSSYPTNPICALRSKSYMSLKKLDILVFQDVTSMIDTTYNKKTHFSNRHEREPHLNPNDWPLWSTYKQTP